ncbi:MAG: DUF2911 domain-containing protein [Bacteroidota bacterium]
MIGKHSGYPLINVSKQASPAIHLRVLFLSAVLLIGGTTAQAQIENNRPSPPAKLEASINGLTVVVGYSRPSKKGRKIFGELEPYGEVWRTGANETTWIDFSQDVKVNGQPIAKGRYALFSIPGETEWTIIFNEKWKDWGAYAYDDKKDVLRIQVPADNQAPETEQFTVAMDSTGQLSLTWDRTRVAFTIRKT